MKTNWQFPTPSLIGTPTTHPQLPPRAAAARLFAALGSDGDESEVAESVNGAGDMHDSDDGESNSAAPLTSV